VEAHPEIGACLHSEIGGIRLEDDILVTADGPVNLSPAPLDLRVL